MGLKPDGLTLERIDNDKGYSPDNCKWATPGEQARNRRSNIYITFEGETLTLSDWADRVGITHQAMKKRLRKWSVERAITAPKAQ